MLSKKSAILRRSPIAIAVMLAGVFAGSSANAALSAISGITLYPGGATVEREVQLSPGSSRLEVTCLPASFDPQSLRLVAPPDVQLGDYRIEDVADTDGQLNGLCPTTATDKRIRTLQAQLAELKARTQAVELSAAYLKSVSEQNAGTSGKSSMLSVSRALEESGYAVFAQRDEIRQQQEETQMRLDALRGDAGDPVPKRTIRIALDAPRGGRLTIAYDTQRAGWIPAYQADLDSSSGQVTLERRALVAQATGEDWQGVKLQLSTSTPVRNTRILQPDTWRLALEEPRPNGYAPAPPPPAMAAQMVPVPRRADTDTPLFAPTRIEGTFLTKFEIPGNIDVPSDAQKVGFTLSHESLPAKVIARVIPAQSTRAWLVAMANRPDGDWPDGDVQLRRDGAQVGQTSWSEVILDDQLALPFGPDEQVFASKADGPDTTGTVKTSNGDASKTLSARYTVKNGHRKPINVEIVESAPVSDSADIKVTSTFTPKPDEAAWQGHQGIVAWKRTLDGGEEVSVGASYTVQYPGKRRVIGLR
ncbi:DUF4139 domain-containing protein [Paraburkholderia dinghuensis]|uniref:Mucoidy inhibitor MuiA family protein n=1 Tax=Paraburkholderia dinghuensis TaxID=2305225 RepID=A0A3N6N0F7_9BURK|nr:DUF4139 domain-containing protein [Paraburkholderia dinghuensis]RQH09778.1 mucoidy inhibitor MuiA family protein [Paraburkholderia dinghuensis]